MEVTYEGYVEVILQISEIGCIQLRCSDVIVS